MKYYERCSETEKVEDGSLFPISNCKMQSIMLLKCMLLIITLERSGRDHAHGMY